MNAAFFGVLMLLLIAVVFYVWVSNINYKTRKEQDRLEALDAIERVETESPEYILTHKPSPYQIEVILSSNPNYHIEQMAIKAALASRNIISLSLVDKYAPRYSEQASRAHWDIIFAKANTIAECEQLLREHRHDCSDWCLAWKAKLEQKIKQARQLEKKVAFLNQARAAGIEVCSICDTVDPTRCDDCNCCISGKRGCSHSFGGLCEDCK